ncbi:MAG: CPBP family intramembrane metalloprotease [Planctomycetales bacterium]|nr:CPBP family intramembrane metalloprotease [Planctomycetales bacterium]
MPKTSDSQSSSVASEWGAILFALIFPTILTWVYFIALEESEPWLQKGAYGIGKVIQFAFPLVFVLLLRKERLQIRGLDASGLALSVGFGLVVAGAMLGLYYFWLKPAGIFDSVAFEVRGKLKGFGITSLDAYAVLAIFYSLVHSLLEEYYWRWFVFGRLRNLTPLTAAVAISSVGFAAHHVLVLAKYFGWGSPATWLFSAGVAVGGVVWAVVYQWSKSLLGPWFSHLLVDAAIFAIGWDLMS